MAKFVAYLVWFLLTTMVLALVRGYFRAEYPDMSPIAVGVTIFLSVMIFLSIQDAFKKKKQASKSESLKGVDEDGKYYEIVWDEFERKEIDKAAWAKAYALSNGDMSKAKALYIQYRVKRLIEEGEGEI